MNPWLKACRLPFLTASLAPVLLGNAVAWQQQGSLDGPIFLLTLLGVALLHCATNMANDYFDHRTRNDELNVHYSLVSGGSRVIQEKALRPAQVLGGALALFGAGALLGLYLAWTLRSPVVLVLGAVGLLSGFFYTGSPVQIGYRGCGEVVVAVAFGPLVVFGSYFVQTLQHSWTPWLAAVPLGIWVGLILYINEFPDYEADSLVHKRTLVVLLGRERAIRLYHGLVFFSYLYTAVMVSVRALPPGAILALLSLPLAWRCYTVSKRNYLDPKALRPANLLTIAVHLLWGLLLSLGFVLDRAL
jgi:1,4-dihydroxy-2-naphthoate polyprenyltransferase